MSSLGSSSKRGLKSLERSTGRKVFTWPVGGSDYICVGNVAESSKTLGVGGFALEADCSIFVRLELLPEPLPAEKQRLIFNGKTYRIDKVSKLPGDEVLKLICNDPTRGA